MGLHKKLGHWLLRVKKVQNVLQGSVTTNLRCGGISNDTFINNLLPCLNMEEF